MGEDGTEIDSLRAENARLKHDLLHAYDRIAAASQVLGQAAERARRQDNLERAAGLETVKGELDEVIT